MRCWPSPGGSRPSSRRAGFSLGELLVTLVVLGMMMGTTVALFESPKKDYLSPNERRDGTESADGVRQFESAIRSLGADLTVLAHGTADMVAFSTDTVGAIAAGGLAGSPRAHPASDPGANGARSRAETRLFGFAPDTTTRRPDDYILYQRTNEGPTEMLARGILAYPDRPFFEYFVARRLSSGLDTLVLASGGPRPPGSQWATLGGTPVGAAIEPRPEDIRAVRINVRITDGWSDRDEQPRKLSQLIPIRQARARLRPPR